MSQTHSPAWYSERDALLWHPYTQMAEYPGPAGHLIVERGEGVYVYDVEGKRFLDGYAQMWCNVWGHHRRELDQALTKQLERIAHSTLFSASNTRAIELADALVSLVNREFKGTFSEPRVFLSDDGSTAVEVALKMAVQYHYNRRDYARTQVLCFDHAYHGDTAATMTLGGVDLFRRAYRPLTFKVIRAPYPMRANAFDPPDASEAETYRESLAAMEAIFEGHGKEIAAAVIEPGCEGAGGIRPLHPGYLAQVRRLCDRYGVLLVADEVLTGFGRCGAYFASAHEGVRPDILCLAKGLSAGYMPLAATVASGEVYATFLGRRDEFRHFFHGHTFTGNQLGCAVALENLAMFEREGLIARIRDQQSFIVDHLREIASLPHVGRIRHYGMMIGIPLVDGHLAGDAGYAGKRGLAVCACAYRKGLLIRPLGDVVVLMPILASGRDELGRLFDLTKEAIVQAMG